ncbi:hypothetical protein CVT26_015233 [Gymnopilus dilepis]|uniref:Uncharacterized protein n=1 Tax=Gymnopilus dilepis TaxID=231916 RepID=A0A409W461_9AGAR|nr:hypothetical protein CVT26_015233 [Gymnopilus dilepis]
MLQVTFYQPNRAGSTESRALDHDCRQPGWKRYYEEHKEVIKAKARERAARVKESETPEEAQQRRDRHREAAARYREANRTKIRVKAWERRWYRRQAQQQEKSSHYPANYLQA